MMMLMILYIILNFYFKDYRKEYSSL